MRTAGAQVALGGVVTSLEGARMGFDELVGSDLTCCAHHSANELHVLDTEMPLSVEVLVIHSSACRVPSGEVLARKTPDEMHMYTSRQAMHHKAPWTAVLGHILPPPLAPE